MFSWHTVLAHHLEMSSSATHARTLLNAVLFDTVELQLSLGHSAGIWDSLLNERLPLVVEN